MTVPSAAVLQADHLQLGWNDSHSLSKGFRPLEADISKSNAKFKEKKAAFMRIDMQRAGELQSACTEKLGTDSWQ